MFRDLTVETSKEIFKIEDITDQTQLHRIIEALMVCYCYAFNRPLKEFSDNFYSEQEASNLVISLIKDAIRIPRTWSRTDLSALSVLLADIGFHAEAKDLRDFLS